VCRKGLGFFSTDLELLFQQGVALREMGDVAGAAASWERCLESSPGAHFASVNTGLRGHITRHNLAAAYRDLGRTKDAETHWRAALKERPQYDPAWRGLANLYLEAQRWQGLESLADLLESGMHGALAAACVRGRMYLIRRQFVTAKEGLKQAIGRFPQALEPRVLLSHVLLQEAKDWSAAGQALRDILALDPANLEAKHNLAVLREQWATI